MSTFVTLGPHGTCHENAVRHYRDFQGLPNAEIELVGDFLSGAEQTRGRADTFLVQSSAHPDVHLVTERFRHQLFVVDTFLFPAKEMALLVRAEVERPKSIGIVSAARGYVDLTAFDTVIEEPANPIVAQGLLDGRYDAGVTIHAYAEQHPDRFRVVERFGDVDTSWVVYGTERRDSSGVIGQRLPWLYGGPAPTAFDRAATYPNVHVGDGYAVGHLGDLGCDYGFRKVRRALGVTAFGINAIVRRPGHTGSRHRHEEQEELYFVHRGALEMRFADGSVHRLEEGGFARVDAGTVRQLRTIGDEDIVYLCAGGKDGYVGRDGRPADWPFDEAE